MKFFKTFKSAFDASFWLVIIVIYTAEIIGTWSFSLLNHALKQCTPDCSGTHMLCRQNAVPSMWIHAPRLEDSATDHKYAFLFSPHPLDDLAQRARNSRAPCSPVRNCIHFK